MRITGTMMSNVLLRDINSNLSRLQRAEQMLSSGRKVRIPQDDPVVTLGSMHLNSSLMENDQYLENTKQASSWLETTDSSLADAGQVLQRARELAVYGANGTLDPESRQAIADEVQQLYDHVFQIANTAHGGRFVFGGQKTSQQPFTQDNATPANIQYDGGDKPLVYEIGPSITLDVGIPGDKVFNQVFDSLKSLHSALLSDPDSISTNVLSDLDAASNKLLRYRSEVGAKVNRLEISHGRLEEMDLNLTDMLSKTEDVDAAEMIIELKTRETAYRLALDVGARIIQPTLMDFLR